MAYVNGTTHYNLPQTVGTDKRDWADTNEAFASLDAAVYSAVEDVADAQTEINGLKDRMTTAEGNITTNTNDISALDIRLTTAEGTITQHTSDIADVRSDCEDMICAYNEATATSTHAYAVGDYFIYNDVLYRAIQAIAIGDTIVPDTNCTTTNVSTEMLAQKSKLIASVTTAEGQTLGGALQALYSMHPTFDKTKEYLLVRERSAATSILHCAIVRVDSLEFSDTSRSSSSEFSIIFYNLSASSNSFLFTVNTSGTITSTNNTTASIPAGDVFKLFELSTI